LNRPVWQSQTELTLSDRSSEPPWWRNVSRQVNVFAAYFAQFLKMRMAYRVDFMIDLMANLVGMIVQLAILTALFANIEALRGWNFEQVLFIYGFSLLPLGLFNIVSINLYRFSEKYIIEGNFDRVLVRPVNPLAQILFESFNVSGLNEILLGTGIMIYANTHLHLVFQVGDVLALLLLAITASVNLTGIHPKGPILIIPAYLVSTSRMRTPMMSPGSPLSELGRNLFE